jgi:hypothetical protein
MLERDALAFACQDPANVSAVALAEAKRAAFEGCEALMAGPAR